MNGRPVRRARARAKEVLPAPDPDPTTETRRIGRALYVYVRRRCRAGHQATMRARTPAPSFRERHACLTRCIHGARAILGLPSEAPRIPGKAGPRARGDR